MLLIQETAEYHRARAPDVAATLEVAVSILIREARRLESMTGRYVVALVGAGNVGKSTLVNALLGSDLAPRRNGPCTAAPIEFVFGRRMRITAWPRHGFERVERRCETVAEIHGCLAELASGDDDSRRAVRKVLVEAPLPLLEHELVIADTPGFGAAQPGASDGVHEQLLCEYLAQEKVAQIFWVVLADQGIGKREKDFFTARLEPWCDDIVVTGSEDWDADDRRRFRQKYESELGGALRRWHFASGLEGQRARAAGDCRALQTAGILQLENQIRALAAPSGRVKAAADRILKLACDLAAWWREQRTPQGRVWRPWWRPDSWGRWKAAKPSGLYKHQLTAALEEPQ